jgi:polyribonucleotide nucleotidyltransferase
VKRQAQDIEGFLVMRDGYKDLVVGFGPVVREEIEWGGKKLSLETGRIARQADGSVLVDYDGTVVLCTVVCPEGGTGTDFLALSVHYQEKFYANGKIPGGFVKRESKPSENEVLTSRLIDRALRPLFPKGFHHEIQVICSVLSYSPSGDPGVAALIGASATVVLSGLPFLGPVCGVRIGESNGQWVINPCRVSRVKEKTAPCKTSDQENLSSMGGLDLTIAATKEGILMIESEAQEVSEEKVLDSISFALEAVKPVLGTIEALALKWGKSGHVFRHYGSLNHFNPEETLDDGTVAKLTQRIQELCRVGLEKIFPVVNKVERVHLLKKFKRESWHLLIEEGFEESACHRFWGKELNKSLRRYMVEKGHRLDGRGFQEVRSIQSQVGLLPRVHGSALFTRGATQSLSIVTLGSKEDGQLVEGFNGSFREQFMLHYNFPPFSVGEAGRVGAPGRREVGHGSLALKALKAVLPSQEIFPYVVRLVSEITESDGSSSMATVCCGSLALMDAGVRISRPVSGIAMGLIWEDDQAIILSDILGEEDGLGDMDFKVAGTQKGITALQMDIKIPGVSLDVLKQALDQAKVGRSAILKTMTEQTLLEHRGALSVSAPRVFSLVIDKEKIRDLIGPGGKMIREICESTGVKIDINDDGHVKVFADSLEGGNQALARIQEISGKPEVGQVYDGIVKTIVDFGAFVRFFGPQEGLVHISELQDGRVEDVRQVLQVGDKVRVMVLGFDNRGKIKLSIRKALDVEGTLCSVEKEEIRSDE